MRNSCTYAILDVSADAYREIRALLVAAGYGHTLHENDGHEVIDMHGIALRQVPSPEPE